ncbi:MAG TPA: hypothetical protein VFJ98_01570 [Mycobacteriales bacterium]|nr:hypothetical protein [Mycobacteriales bacterium]
MSRGWNAVAALALAGALAACSGNGSTTASPTPTVTPTTDATTPAGEQAQRLAQAGLDASYHASYLARQDQRPHRADWNVAHTPSALRIDVVTGGRTATLIVSTKGAFSCARAGHRQACFRVAKPGHAVPPPFDHAPQALFTTDLHTIAQHAGAYAITDVAPSAGGGRAQDSCFRVRATAAAPQPKVPTGVYCFADVGVLTAIRFPTGSTVRLVTVRMSRPSPAVFRPYSSPTPIP